MKLTRFIVLVLILGIFSAGIAYCQERISISTYYPSPEGVYKNMTLYPHDDFDPAVACSQDGAMYYDDSENRGYICEGGAWQSMAGGFKYLGRVDISANGALGGSDSATVSPPLGTRYMFIGSINGPTGICEGSTGARVENQGTSSVYGKVEANGYGSNSCNIHAWFDCFE